MGTFLRWLLVKLRLRSPATPGPSSGPAVAPPVDPVDDPAPMGTPVSPPLKSSVAWSAHVEPACLAELIRLCDRRKIEPSYLMACIAFETAQTFSPAVVNRLTKATGLIQFLPHTALALDTTVEALARMTCVEQLTYVERYLEPYTGRLDSLSDVYMAILWPAAIGKPENYPLFAEDTASHKAYTQNAGLDADHDRIVTKGEAASRVQDLLIEGLKPENRA